LKLLLIAAVTGFGIYLLFRLLVYLGRPLYLENAFREIDEQYTGLLRLAEKDLETAIEHYNSGKTEGSTVPPAEEGLLEQVNRTRRIRDHEREINDKFLRLRMRFPSDFKKQAESVAAYRAYLRVRLYQEEFASKAGLAGTAAGTPPEERFALHQEQYEEARKLLVALEESENRLNALLSGN
jgi:hypothetical protein